MYCKGTMIIDHFNIKIISHSNMNKLIKLFQIMNKVINLPQINLTQFLMNKLM